MGSGSSPGQSPGSTMLHTFHSLQQRRLENWINTLAGGFREKPAKAWASSVLEGGGRVVVGNPSGRRLFNSSTSADEGANAARGKKLAEAAELFFLLMKPLRSFFSVREDCIFRDGRQVYRDRISAQNYYFYYLLHNFCHGCNGLASLVWLCRELHHDN